METYLPGDIYQTPADRPSRVLRALSARWRWFFYPQYFVEALRTSTKARFGRYADEDWARSSANVMRIIERNGGMFDIRGIENIRSRRDEGPFVFVSNHMSTLETQVYPVLIVPFMPVTFVVKAELMKHPFLGPVLQTRDPIPVARQNARDDLKTVLEEGPKRLARGMSLVIFPQATRTPQFRRASFNSLGIKLAASAGVKVVPMAIKSDFWGEHGRLRGFGPVRPDQRIHVEFGEPMAVQGRGRQEHEAVVEFIETRLRSWGADVQ